MNKKIYRWWKDSLGFKPIFSYLNFLFLFLFHKKATYIIPIISLFLVILFLLIPTFFTFNTTKSDSFVKSVSALFFYFSTAVCAFLTITFIAIKTTNIFKDNETEGVELLIVAKPIQRWQIIFSKFIVLVVISLFISLINTIAFSIGFAVTWNSRIVNSGFGYTVLIVFFSSIVLSFVFGAITTFLNLKFGKKLSTSLPFNIFMILFIVSIIVSLLPTYGVDVTAPNQFLTTIGDYQYYDSLTFQELEYQQKNTLIIKPKNVDDSTSNTEEQLSWEDQISLDVEKIFNKNSNAGWWYKAIKWLNVAFPILEEQNSIYGGLNGLTSDYYVNSYLSTNSSFYFDSDYGYKIKNSLPKNEDELTIIMNPYQTTDSTYLSSASETYYNLEYEDENGIFQTFNGFQIGLSDFAGDSDFSSMAAILMNSSQQLSLITNTISSSKKFQIDVKNKINSFSQDDYKNNLKDLYDYFLEDAYLDDGYININTYTKKLNSWEIYSYKGSDLVVSGTNTTYELDLSSPDGYKTTTIETYYDLAPLIFTIASLEYFYNNYEAYNEYIDLYVNDENNTYTDLTYSVCYYTVDDETHDSNSQNSSGNDYSDYVNWENQTNFTIGSQSSPLFSATNDLIVISTSNNQSPNWAIILFWFLISIGMLTISWWVYLNKDFK